MPRFSIIVPVYNVKECLRQSLDSVERQSFSDWECICVDDGSTDGSSEVLDFYAEKNARFRVIHQPNAGVSAARNVALAQMRGEWILFLDADDALHPHALEWLDQKCRDETLDAIKFGYQAVDAIPVCPPALKDPIVCERYDLSDADAFRRAFNRADVTMRVWNGCYRKQAIYNVRCRPIGNGEDALLAMECFGVARAILCANVTLHYYYQHLGSATKTVSLKMMADHARLHSLMFAVARKWLFFGAIADSLRRRIRTALAGSTLSLLYALPDEMREVGWRIFFDELDELLAQNLLFGRIERLVYKVVSARKSRIGVWLCLRLPVRIKRQIRKLVS